MNDDRYKEGTGFGYFEIAVIVAAVVLVAAAVVSIIVRPLPSDPQPVSLLGHVR